VDCTWSSEIVQGYGSAEIIPYQVRPETSADCPSMRAFTGPMEPKGPVARDGPRVSPPSQRMHATSRNQGVRHAEIGPRSFLHADANAPAPLVLHTQGAVLRQSRGVHLLAAVVEKR
jgi:hypothetical protein